MITPDGQVPACSANIQRISEQVLDKINSTSCNMLSDSSAESNFSSQDKVDKRQKDVEVSVKKLLVFICLAVTIIVAAVQLNRPPAFVNSNVSFKHANGSQVRRFTCYLLFVHMHCPLMSLNVWLLRIVEDCWLLNWLLRTIYSVIYADSLLSRESVYPFAHSILFTNYFACQSARFYFVSYTLHSDSLTISSATQTLRCHITLNIDVRPTCFNANVTPRLKITVMWGFRKI